jgi:hypothetical protein
MIYDLLFTASAETMLTIAADPKHLGARIGITSVLHSWGSAADVARWRLDLDHIGAQIPKRLGAVRTSEHPAEVDNAQAFQGSRHGQSPL